MKLANKTDYSVAKATFLNLPPVYQSNDNDLGFQINYCATTHRSEAFSTLIGLSYCDKKYNLFLNHLINKPIIVSDSDIIGHDCYITKLRKNQTIVLYFSGLNTSPSKKRIFKAVKKLRGLGFKVNYFASKETAEKFVAAKLA